MKFTVTLTLEVDEQAYANHYLGGDVPADVLRGDVALAASDAVAHLLHTRVVSVTDKPESE